MTQPILNPPQSDLHFLGFLIAGFAILFWALFLVPHWWERPAKLPRRRRDTGMILLTEMIIVCAIVLLLVSVPLLNLARISAANNSTQVIAAIRTTNLGMGFFARVYGEGFAPSPAYLAIQPTVAQSCAAPSLLPNQVASAYANSFAGYTLTFTAGPASGLTGNNCPGQGISSYSITATPLVPLSGTNSYFSDQMGVLHCDAPTVTATTASPVCGF